MSIQFKIKKSSELNGVIFITPSISEDQRGNIWTSFISDEIEKYISADIKFSHDKFSKSNENVLRGIHGDSKSWKIVSCVYGEIDQVIVDMRVNSSTYKKYIKVNLNSNQPKSIVIPPNFGNAYYVKSNEALYHYKLAYNGDYFDKDKQFTVKWNDPSIKIDWNVEKPTLSERDR